MLVVNLRAGLSMLRALSGFLPMLLALQSAGVGAASTPNAWGRRVRFPKTGGSAQHPLAACPSTPSRWQCEGRGGPRATGGTILTMIFQ